MRRPVGVVLIALIYVVNGAASIAEAALTAATALTQYFTARAVLLATSLLTLCTGAAQIIVAYKLVKGSRYAYYIAVVLSLIDLISAVFNKSLGGALFASAILFYLLRKKTRQYFLSSKKQPKTIVENYLNTKQNEGERVC